MTARAVPALHSARCSTRTLNHSLVTDRHMMGPTVDICNAPPPPRGVRRWPHPPPVFRFGTCSPRSQMCVRVVRSGEPTRSADGAACWCLTPPWSPRRRPVPPSRHHGHHMMTAPTPRAVPLRKPLMSRPRRLPPSGHRQCPNQPAAAPSRGRRVRCSSMLCGRCSSFTSAPAMPRRPTSPRRLRQPAGHRTRGAWRSRFRSPPAPHAAHVPARWRVRRRRWRCIVIVAAACLVHVAAFAPDTSML